MADKMTINIDEIQ